MNKFKVGDKVQRVGCNFGKISVGDVYTVRSTESDGDVRLEGYLGCYDRNYFIKLGGNMKKQEKKVEDTSWEFSVSSDKLIDLFEIQDTLTREHPMAIIHRSDGTCMVQLHDSVWQKGAYVSKRLEVELHEAIKPFDTEEWPAKNSAILSRIVCAVRAVRSAKIKKKYHGILTCKVEMIKL